MTERVIITIDGPAGTGKSTVAHGLACRLGLEFLDTGAMYRAAALASLDQDIDPSDGAALRAALDKIIMRFEWHDDPPSLLLQDRDVTSRLRDLDVSSRVSIVAGQPEIREALVAQQRDIATRHPRLVTEGRDQGSVVFPDAQVKFYLDAQVSERARRRHLQLTAAGKRVTYDTLLAEMIRRDELDSTREVGPLRKPEAAVVVDTGKLTLADVITTLERRVRAVVDGSLIAQPAGSLEPESLG